jgi:hypothetical protein
MRTANRGRVPNELLEGYYELATQTATFAIYRRNERRIDPGRKRLDGFLENLAHPAYAERIAINGLPVRVETESERLSYLWQGPGADVTVDPTWTLHLDLRLRAPVNEIYIEGGVPSQDLRIDVLVEARSTGALRRIESTLRGGETLLWRRSPDWRDPIDAIDVRFVSITGAPVRFHLNAVRIMGQTGDLVTYLLRRGVPAS